MKKFLPKLKNNPQGFTLVELLVVIAIIAILSVIGITVFTGLQKNARDARRRADVDSISKALEVAYDRTTAQYPFVIPSMFSGGIIPTDPINSAPSVYTYPSTAAATTYCVCASLEAGRGGNSSNSTCSVTADGSYYCRKNQQ